jgi:hypothetical protein
VNGKHADSKGNNHRIKKKISSREEVYAVWLGAYDPQDAG